MLNVFQDVLRQFVAQSLEKECEMLLEADVVGWLFHLLLMQSQVSPQLVHLNTRVFNVHGFFDIVVGRVQTTENGRPSTRPQLAVEVKIFPRIGFTDQQHRVHFEHIVKDDLRKLGQLGFGVDLSTALIVDGRGYLRGTYHGQNRLQYLIERRNAMAPAAHVFVIGLADGNWRIEHRAPANG